MPSGRGGGVIPPAVAACGDEAVKAVIVATPANTMPATAKPPIVPNNFDFKVLYDILIPPCDAFVFMSSPSVPGPSLGPGTEGDDMKTNASQGGIKMSYRT